MVVYNRQGFSVWKWWRALGWFVSARNVLDKYIISSFGCWVLKLHLHFDPEQSVTVSNFICVY